MFVTSAAPEGPAIAARPGASTQLRSTTRASGPVPRGRAAWALVPRSERAAAATITIAHLVLATVLVRHHVVATVAVLGVADAALGAAALIDRATYRIPDDLLSWTAICTLVAAAFGGPTVTAHLALGALIATAPMVGVLLARDLGIGDVKMAAVVGALGGVVHPVVGLGAVFAMALGSSLSGLVTRRRRAALGPWLWSGHVLSSSVAMILLADRSAR